MVRCSLVRIDSQGYVNGRYFGVNRDGIRLYMVSDEYTDRYLRAHSREQALRVYNDILQAEAIDYAAGDSDREDFHSDG